MRELMLRTKGDRLEVIPDTLRICNTEEPIRIKAELGSDWKYYDAYEIIFKYFGCSDRVKLSKSLECEVPSELLSMEAPSYLYDKDHKRTIYAELMGIIYSVSGEYAINLKRSRIESIIIIETAEKIE